MADQKIQVQIADVVAFIEGVQTKQIEFSSWVTHKDAYTQYMVEVQMLGGFTPDKWFTDEYRRRLGWPQQIISDYLDHQKVAQQQESAKEEKDDILETLRQLKEEVAALKKQAAGASAPPAPADEADEPEEDSDEDEGHPEDEEA